MTDPTHNSQGDPPQTTGEHAKRQAQDVAETGKQEAGKVASEVKNQGYQLLDQARGQVKERADSQVGQIAGFLDQVSGELDQMASGTSEESQTYLTALVRDTAKGAQSLADRLDQGGLEGALDDVRRFARRRPVTFLAGAFGVGLLLGRVTRNADLEQITSDGSKERSRSLDPAHSEFAQEPREDRPFAPEPAPAPAQPGLVKPAVDPAAGPGAPNAGGFA